MKQCSALLIWTVCYRTIPSCRGLVFSIFHCSCVMVTVVFADQRHHLSLPCRSWVSYPINYQKPQSTPPIKSSPETLTTVRVTTLIHSSGTPHLFLETEESNPKGVVCRGVNAEFLWSEACVCVCVCVCVLGGPGDLLAHSPEGDGVASLEEQLRMIPLSERWSRWKPCVGSGCLRLHFFARPQALLPSVTREGEQGKREGDQEGCDRCHPIPATTLISLCFGSTLSALIYIPDFFLSLSPPF